MDNNPNGFVARFLRFVLKVFLALIALVFAVCLLVIAVLAVVFTLIKALVTWQKPTPWVVFRRVQKYSAQGQWPGNPYSQKARQGKPTPDVVDVEVREVLQDDAKQ